MAGELLSAFEAAVASGDSAVVDFIVFVISVARVCVGSRGGGVACASGDEDRGVEDGFVEGERHSDLEGHASVKFGAADCNEISFYDVAHSLVESLGSIEEIRVVEVAWVDDRDSSGCVEIQGEINGTDAQGTILHCRFGECWLRGAAGDAVLIVGAMNRWRRIWQRRRRRWMLINRSHHGSYSFPDGIESRG